jgi:DNA protecting protein DprA
MNFFTIPAVELPLLRHVDGFRAPEDLHFQSERDPRELLATLPEEGLAIVGTRYPQRRSFELLETVMRELRGSGLVIISGFARGIDSRAHELAIENGLRTIAILGCGLDLDYPRENRALRRRILESGGMMVSHFPYGTVALPRNFLERNQLIAGFARATWVVEAAEVSGTLNTAMWATRMNRNLYATSCYPGDPFFKGNEKLLSQQHPDRYPVAEPLFGAHSLATSWSFLAEGGQTELLVEPDPNPPRAETRIQAWVLELESEFGTCHVQTLMNHASSQGLTLGKFYLEFESEVESGRLIHSPDGRVQLARVSSGALAESTAIADPGHD